MACLPWGCYMEKKTRIHRGILCVYYIYGNIGNIGMEPYTHKCILLSGRNVLNDAIASLKSII